MLFDLYEYMNVLIFFHLDSLGFPIVSDGKEFACNAGDLGLISASGEGNGNPLQYSCLKDSMDRGAWPATIHGVSKSQK